MDIELLPFERNDFERLIRWVPTPEFLMLWSGPYFLFPLDKKQLETYLVSAEGDPPPRKIYKAFDRDTHTVVGHIELNNIDWRNMAGTVSKVLVGQTDQRGNGIGTQMMKILLEIAFNSLKLHRLSLIVFDFNQPAIQCYQKVGFKIEGHMRDTRKIGQEYWSSYLMALLEQDWRSQNILT
jgi:RimJ/RimL family protein N-acetyltransferase